MMSFIHLTTFIAAPIDRVFDLSRSIGLHRISAIDNDEKAIAGTTTGLINENETVTWQARHLYRTRRFTSKITVMKRPEHFRDEMISGDFKSLRHDHHFKTTANGTIMIDMLKFECPYGIIGRLFSSLYLKNYLEKFLVHRNSIIKEYAETEKWNAILN